MAKKKIPSKDRLILKESLRLAYAGKVAWLHDLVTSAGYIGNLSSLTAKQVGQIMGKSSQAVGFWHSRMGCPRNKDATYDLLKVVAWRIENEAKRMAGASVTTVLSEKEKYESAIYAEKLRKLKRENDEKEARLVSVDDVCRSLGAIADMFRGQAATIERAYGDEAGSAMDGVIKRVIRDTEKLFERWKEGVVGGRDDS